MKKIYKGILCLFITAALLLIGAFGLCEAEPKQKGGRKSSVALLEIEGELYKDSYDYDHIGTINAIEDAIDDENNLGLILLMNTPGGGIYEADELFHELSVYKTLTGRPIYVFMEQECCSAGVYVAMAGDYIMASRMTITGSVGVYMSTISEAGLFDKLGIEQIYIASGVNKVSGYPELTDDQRAITQSLVDEAFGFFKEIISASRNLTEEQMLPFLDGRELTATQALQYGLIDEICYYEEAIDKAFELGKFGDAQIKDITPEYDYGYSYPDSDTPDEGTLLDWLLGMRASSMVKQGWRVLHAR